MRRAIVNEPVPLSTPVSEGSPFSSGALMSDRQGPAQEEKTAANPIRRPLHVMMVAAECVPYACVGGLSEVVASLPQALHALPGQPIRCTIVMPKYAPMTPERFTGMGTSIEETFWSTYEGVTQAWQVWQGVHPADPSVTVVWLEQLDTLGQQQAVYEGDTLQQQWRFGAFSQAVLTWIQSRAMAVDVLHLHDWHVAPLAGLLKGARWDNPKVWGETRSLLTLHNIAYQGEWGWQNPLKHGVMEADALNTVSPSYRDEILTEPAGAGLSALLKIRAAQLTGILNGIDTVRFNPATDPDLPKPYSAAQPLAEILAAKTAAKRLVLRRLGVRELPKDDTALRQRPLLGMVGRLVSQKGLDYLLPALEGLAYADTVDVVFVGSGDPRFASRIRHLMAHFPNVMAHLGFDEVLARQVFAACDWLLMPSVFEPCGLSQLMALRYGTPVLARRTGGLRDTVVDWHADPERSTGIVVDTPDGTAMNYLLGQAMALYTAPHAQHGTVHAGMVQRALTADNSWGRSAQAYAHLYAQLCGVPVA